MNQRFVIVDEFYDKVLLIRKSFLEKGEPPVEEASLKFNQIFGKPVQLTSYISSVQLEDCTETPIMANVECDWIAVVYLTLPADCVSKKGLSLYRHKKTNLDSLPDDYVAKMMGIQSVDDVNETFDFFNKDDWEEYSSIFMKYNRCIIIKSTDWHTYGEGFGNEINNSMMYQTWLIKDGN